jgi:Flp pilus assembly protein TadB
MLAVQDRIDEVQLTIEQLSAQLASLRETTTYATLTVDLREKGTPQAGAIDSTDTFWGTFVNSLSLLARGARATGILLTAVLPFALVFGAMGAAAWYATRRLRRGRGQAAPPSLPA